MKKITILNNSHRIYLIIFITFIIGLCSLLKGKKEPGYSKKTSSRLELIHADISRGKVENDQTFKILEGNVHARQDTLELYCNRAVYNEKKEKITLLGNVKLIRGKDTLLAKRVDYFERRQIAFAEKDVQIFRPGQKLQSDFLEYYYKTDKIRAEGNLFLRDEENLVTVTAKEGEYLPEDSLSFVRRDAHLWRVDSLSGDTLHIYSKFMVYYTGKKRRAIARDSVHIYQENLHATCDSAVYMLRDDIVYLEGTPRATQENNKVFGKRIQLILNDMKLKEIKVNENAQAISVIDSLLEKENRLEGREIVMYIESRKIREVWAISNAKSFYHLKEKEEGRGINVASADTIKAFLKKNELDSISVIGGSQGIYYPENYKGPILQE